MAGRGKYGRKASSSTSGKTTPRSTPENKAFQTLGKQLISNEMTDQERANLCSKSGTLHFVQLLGTASRKSSRYVIKPYLNANNDISNLKSNNKRIFKGDYPPCETVVGVTLISDEDIKVPKIDMHLVKELMRRKRGDEETYLDIENDISYVDVEAGKQFHLSLYEFMFLVIRPEYGGVFEVNGDPRGAYLRVRTPKAVEEGTATLRTSNGKVMLPVPSIMFYAKGKGSPKSTMIAIDQQSPEGRWVIRPEYERFEVLVSRTGNLLHDKILLREEKRARVKQSNSVKNDSTALVRENSVNLIDYPETFCLVAALRELLFSKNNEHPSNEESLLAYGNDIINSMDENRRTKLGSKSGTLHFVNELVYKNHRNFQFSTPGKLKGVTLFSDEEIQVPVIPLEDERKVNDPTSDILYRKVKPGEHFALTLFEFMFLIMQEEYSGCCEAFGDSNGLCFSPALAAYLEGKSNFPSPRISYSSSSGNITRKSITDLNGNAIEILPEYSEKFGSLMSM